MGAGVETGLERVFEEGALRARLEGRRVAWLVHAASVDARLRHAVDRSLALGWRVARLFGPEHGLRGAAQDMIGVGGGRDPLSGLEVVSLYGHDAASLRPPPGSLDGLDVVLIDLQDIGARYYTYAYTAALMVEACAAAGVEAWVLDRPNPLGGVGLEGGTVAEGLRSFVGLYALPARHGLTIGELLTLLAARHGWGDALEVVEQRGWTRQMRFEDTGLPWVLPSPNMPTPDTARVYPGMCLLEGTNLSEGRGTTRPFEVFGAPWLDTASVGAALDPRALEGCALRPLVFEPTFQKHARQACAGFQLHVTDAARFRSLTTALGLLQAIRATHPDAFAWRTDAYEFVADRLAIDLLLGDTTLRHALEDGASLADLEAALAAARAPFEDEREAFVRYPAG